MKYTNAQILLAVHCRELGLRTEFEYRFCHRLWAFDIAIPDLRLGIECNGGRWTGGHYRGKAVDNEYEKLNTAQMLGWRVLQFTNEFADKGDAKAFIEKWLSTDQISDSPALNRQETAKKGHSRKPQDNKIAVRREKP